MSENALTTAVILVGGKGLRLREAVADRPKPLAWVAGRPFLSHLLAELETAGFQRCILATGHLGTQFSQTYGQSFGKMGMFISSEEVPLGTGGALREAVTKFSLHGSVAVLNGDSLCRCDWKKLRLYHVGNGLRATVVVTPATGHARFGSIRRDEAGRVVSFSAEPPETPLINAGIYALDTELCREIPAGRLCSLESEVFPEWAVRGLMGSFLTEGPLLDIGLPESYALAQRKLRDAAPLQFESLASLRGRSPAASALLAPRQREEINKWKIAVGVIVRNVRGDILLERRSDCGLWGLPGGRLDLGESVVEAAQREVKEETGLEIRVERLVGVYSRVEHRVLSYPGGDIVQCLTVVIEASVPEGGRITLSEESLEMRFFPPDAIPADTIPHAQQYLADCLQTPEAILD